jgi:hypothetical protein
MVAAGSAGAAPYVRQPNLAINTQTPAIGATVTLTGTGYVAGTTVTLTLHSTPVTLGTVTPNASGNFTTAVALPAGVSGTHTIVGAGNATNDSASVTIDIGGSGTGGGSSGGGGSLSSTGVAVLSIGSIGVLLLLGGGAMLLAGRRRKLSV